MVTEGGGGCAKMNEGDNGEASADKGKGRGLFLIRNQGSLYFLKIYGTKVCLFVCA